MKSIYSVFVGLTILTIASVATAESATANESATSTKVVTVDIARVLNECGEGKSKRIELEGKSKKLKEQIAAKQKSLIEKQQKLGVSAEAATPEAESFRTDIRDFERFAKDGDETLKKEFLTFNSTLTKKVVAAIKTIAETEHYDLVLDRDAAGRGIVLYGKTTEDITDRVLKKMGT